MYSGQCLCETHCSGRGFLKIVSPQGCYLGRHCPQTGILPMKHTHTHTQWEDCIQSQMVRHKDKKTYEEQTAGIQQNKFKSNYDLKRRTALTCPGKGSLWTQGSGALVSLQLNACLGLSAGKLNPHPSNLTSVESPSWTWIGISIWWYTKTDKTLKNEWKSIKLFTSLDCFISKLLWAWF